MKLQVKYCSSLNELNAFLKILCVDNTDFPCLQNIYYLTRVSGDGVETATPDEKGITAKAAVGSSIIAVVQYFIGD